jgi:hypothetical protein
MNRNIIYVFVLLTTFLGAEFILRAMTIVGYVEAIESIEGLVVIPYLPLEDPNRLMNFKAKEKAQLIHCREKSVLAYILELPNKQQFSILYGGYQTNPNIPINSIHWHVEQGSLLNFYQGAVWFCQARMKEELLKQIK